MLSVKGDSNQLIYKYIAEVDGIPSMISLGCTNNNPSRAILTLVIQRKMCVLCGGYVHIKASSLYFTKSKCCN